MVRCVRCGGENPQGKRFCGDCGSPLGATCAACGAALIAGKRYCGDCGTPVAELGGGEPALSVPVAERRVCSVLFADLVGFTTLSQSRDPEDVRELLSRYFATARTVVQRYGGTVEKFIGDAVMAVWGAPVALEGDTERAVRAGLDLVAAVSALGHEVGAPDLTARAGVVTGDVAVTIGAVGEGMVAGDAVNTAARVQAAASPGDVLVDAATRRLAAAAVGFDEIGELRLQGKAQPEQLWRAVRVLSGVGGAQRVDGLEAPLTGRAVELRLVKDLFHACVERSAPRLVVISGPAGVGKSRLGWEFEKYVDGLAEPVYWHRGHCLSYGEGIAFWALAEIVRARLGIAEEDPADTAARKLADGLDRLVLDPTERAYVGVRLAQLLGVGARIGGPGTGGDGRDESPQSTMSREELFAGWRLFFERLAQAQPVVLLIEDAQYADAGLLDFLDHLVDWARDIAVFVLVFSRPELELARPGFGAGRNRTALALDPLDPAAMEQLLEALVPGLPAEAMRAIGLHAQGIPLFAVETVRSLIDRDIVQPRDGAYALVAEVGELEVPDSLHALLAARLDALDRGARALVADAAVLGGNFPEEALIAVSQAPPDVVRAALSDLVRRDLLEISADALSPQLGTYRFTHDMLRQVAYDTLSRRDRKARHLAVADYLRSAFAGDGDEMVEVIAQHHLDALQAVPGDDDTESLRAETVALLARAGTRAVRTGSPASALTSFVTAAELAEEGGDVAGDVAAAGLWESAARAALSTADWDTAVAHACHAAGLLRRQGRVRGAARAEVVAGRAQASAGRVSEAHELLSGAVDVLRAEPDADLVEALASLAAYNVLSGLPGGDDLSVEALRLGQALGVGEATLADLLVTRGLAHALADRNLQAVMYYREAARRAEEVGATPVLIRALVNLSNSLGEDDAAASVAHARLAAQHARRLGERWGVSIGVANQVIALVELGNWDEAAGLLSDAATHDGLEGQPHIDQYSAVLHALRGDGAPVHELLERTDAAATSEDPQELALLALIRALLAHAEKDSSSALLHARSAVGFAHVLGIRCETSRWGWPLAARAAYELDDAEATDNLLDMLDRHPRGHLPPMLRLERDLAHARLRVSRQQGAGAELMTEAVANMRMLGSPYHLGHALLDQAQAADAGGNPAASDLVGEALAIAQQLGAGPLRERAEQVQATLLQATT